MTLEIIPFNEEMLPQAGVLLAQRHRRDRASLPELPARLEEPANAGKALEVALQRQHAGGFAALDNGRLVAYLVGDMAIDSVWGRSGWVRTAGCAYEAETGVEIIRDLYAALGARWVEYGIFAHFALVPVRDPELIHAWFSLSFGIEQVHALADLEALDPTLPAIPPGVEIRQAGPADRQHLAEMSDVIWRTQVKAPVWAAMMPEAVSETEAGWADMVNEAAVTAWLALTAGKVAGVQGYWPPEPAGDYLLVPENCVHMSAAGTRAEARGRGIGTLLTRYGLAQARAAGYRFCEADWRSANLLASRFWPRWGFRPVAYRLVRRVDERIAWADGTAQ